MVYRCVYNFADEGTVYWLVDIASWNDVIRAGADLCFYKSWPFRDFRNGVGQQLLLIS